MNEVGTNFSMVLNRHCITCSKLHMDIMVENSSPRIACEMSACSTIQPPLSFILFLISLFFIYIMYQINTNQKHVEI